MLNCKIFQLDFLFSQEQVLHPMMVCEDLGHFHRFAQGCKTGHFIHPYRSEKYNKFEEFGNKLVEALGSINGQYCIEIFER